MSFEVMSCMLDFEVMSCMLDFEVMSCMLDFEATGCTTNYEVMGSMRNIGDFLSIVEKDIPLHIEKDIALICVTNGVAIW